MESASSLLSYFMRILGIAFMSLFLAHTASAGFAFDRRPANAYNGSGVGATGEGVGTGFLSCGCAEQQLKNTVVKGGPCDNFGRLYVNAVTSPSVAGGTAPASPQASHQLIQ